MTEQTCERGTDDWANCVSIAVVGEVATLVFEDAGLEDSQTKCHCWVERSCMVVGNLDKTAESQGDCNCLECAIS